MTSKLRICLRWAIAGLLLVLLSAVAMQGAQASPPVVGIVSDTTLDSGLRTLASELAKRMSARGVKKLAIVEFSDLGGYESVLGLYLAEELTTRLLQTESGGFDIVERQQLAKVLEEQKLTATALFDADTIAKVGEILGIQAIVTGSIADLGEEIKINARSISVESALVFAAASARVQKKGVVENLMRQGASPNLRGGASTPRPGGRRVQASDVFFQNSFLRLTVASLAVFETGERATLALTLENLTAADLYLAIEYASSYCQTQLIDDRGTTLKPSEFPNGIVCLYYKDEGQPQERFSQFSAKSRSTIVIPFSEIYQRRRSSRGGSEPSREPAGVFAVGLNLLRHNQGRTSRFSAGVSNIEASSP